MALFVNGGASSAGVVREIPLFNMLCPLRRSGFGRALSRKSLGVPGSNPGRSVRFR